MTFIRFEGFTRIYRTANSEVICHSWSFQEQGKKIKNDRCVKDRRQSRCRLEDVTVFHKRMQLTATESCRNVRRTVSLRVSPRPLGLTCRVRFCSWVYAGFSGHCHYLCKLPCTLARCRTLEGLKIIDRNLQWRDMYNPSCYWQMMKLLPCYTEAGNCNRLH